MYSLKLYMILAVCAAIVASFVYVWNNGKESALKQVKNKDSEAFSKGVEESNVLGQELEKQLTSMKVENRKITERLENVSKTDYSVWVVPADGMRIYNQSRQGSSTK